MGEPEETAAEVVAADEAAEETSDEDAPGDEGDAEA